MRPEVAVFRRLCRAAAARSRSGIAAAGRRFPDSRLAVAAVALAAAMPITSVSAQTTVYAVGDGAPNSAQLNVNVLASVGGRCGFADLGRRAAPSTSAISTSPASATISCSR
jgi:hypothetical protein